MPVGKNIQEEGIKFFTGDDFQTLAWDRNSYFTAYPETHIGKPNGKVDLNEKPTMNYRKFPNHSWGMETKGFYNFGLKEALPYTNMVRSLKENIYSYSLSTKENSKIEVFSDGKQACRFDKIDGENTLIINDKWDYSSLSWGNYMKLIKSENEYKGQVKFWVKGQ